MPQRHLTHRKPVQDEHKILGTVVGAALGGVVGHQFGGGSGKKVATAAGAVAGGYAGNQVQGNMQAGDTYTTTEQRCRDGAGAAPTPSAMTSPTASPARRVVRMEKQPGPYHSGQGWQAGTEQRAGVDTPLGAPCHEEGPP